MTDVNDAFPTLGRSDAVPNGYVMPYYPKDRKHRIAVARVDDRLYAFDDLSPTYRSPLSSGLLAGTVIMSPCDASRFDVTTGKPVGGPATAPLPTYEVREVDGEIEVRLAGARS